MPTNCTNPLGYLIDLDGTLISGGVPLPNAAWLLEKLAGRFVVVSNDAEHTREELAFSLQEMGLNVAPGRIILAGVAAIDLIAQSHPGAKVMVLASQSLQKYAEKSGLIVSMQKCDLVLVGRDRQFSYDRLGAAAAAVAGGAPLWLACPDTSHRGRRGEPVPETGALAAAIIAASGVTKYRVVGKPQPALFETGLALLGLASHQAAVIGDNPATDGKGAAALGMRFLHVEPGDLGPSLFDVELERA